jgi:hypothetical protein
MSYLDNDSAQSYRASIDWHNIEDDMMTDAGVRVCDLHPIQDCILTPGDGSPVGRTEDGDLAYIIRRESTTLDIKRVTCAELAVLMLKDGLVKGMPSFADCNDIERTFLNLYHEAFPEMLFSEDSAMLGLVEDIKSMIEATKDDGPLTKKVADELHFLMTSTAADIAAG